MITEKGAAGKVDEMAGADDGADPHMAAAEHSGKNAGVCR
jgi:hypothetical protein